MVQILKLSEIRIRQIPTAVLISLVLMRDSVFTVKLANIVLIISQEVPPPAVNVAILWGAQYIEQRIRIDGVAMAVIIVSVCLIPAEQKVTFFR